MDPRAAAASHAWSSTYALDRNATRSNDVERMRAGGSRGGGGCDAGFAHEIANAAANKQNECFMRVPEATLRNGR